MIEAARRAGAYHAAWSGAGPSTMALAPEHLAARVQEAVEAVLGGAGTSACLDIDYDGWR